MAGDVESPATRLVRRLGPEDHPHCVALDRRARRAAWSENQWRSELAGPRRPCLGIWQEGALRAVACGWLILEELHISLVAVDPRHRRRGLAALVLEALLREAIGEGAERATLEVSAGNTAALALYAAFGFAVAGRRRGYYHDGQDALIQWVELVNPLAGDQ